jgi:glycosyltransferase involved in cell wall biosynthesis
MRDPFLIKIVAILDNSIGAGGGYDQALNAILQMQRLSRERFIFEVLTTQKINMEHLSRLGIKAAVIRFHILDMLLVKISQNQVWQSLQSRLKIIGPLEKRLISMGCDVVYFLTPGNLPLILQKLNYINTAWDFCHRETPEFPEVRNFNIFSIRDKIFQTTFGAALFTLTDSNKSTEMASQFYGVDPSRFVAMPFGVSPLLEGGRPITEEAILEKYSLKKGYLFYPAQFWAHKNHIRILQALIILRTKYGWTPDLILSGKDYGNLAHVHEFIKENDLAAQVRVLGFVPHVDLMGLYKNSIAVVMPTYFGLTNLPPLEAWSLGVPLIYSAQFFEQAKDAALLIDPDDANELSAAIYSCLKADIRSGLVLSGYKRLEEIDAERKVAEEKICLLLKRFGARRQCWA